MFRMTYMGVFGQLVALSPLWGEIWREGKLNADQSAMTYHI